MSAPATPEGASQRMARSAPSAGAARTAAAHRRVKRAMGLLREAARVLAAEDGELDVVAELVDPTDAEVLEALELVRRRYRRDQPIDVLILGRGQP